jgi:hypothetical protein
MSGEEILEKFREVAKAIDGCSVDEGCFILTRVLGGIFAAAELSEEDAKGFADAVAQDVLEAYKNFKEGGKK